MNGSVLTIGGEYGDDTATSFSNLDELTFTDAASSLGSWRATLPSNTDFSELLFEPVYIYHDNEVLFRGELESFETDYTAGTTQLAGRGVLVDLDRRTQTVTYTNTTVYEALTDAWASTPYDVNVYPPNRGVFDETYATQLAHTSLWSFDGDSATSVLNPDVTITPDGRVEFTAPNVTLDEKRSGSQGPAMYADEPVTRFGVIIETVEPIQSLTVTLKSRAGGGLDAGNIEVVSDTVSYDTPQRFHVFDFELTQSNTLFRLALETGAETFSITRTEAFSVNPDGFANIDELELTGTQFENLQELHDTGAYTFAVRDFETLDIAAFPVNTVAGQPAWDVVDSTRTLDYANYANQVTVHGKTLSDGTINTATRTNQAEVNRLANLGVGDDGVIANFEKNTEVQTQSEVDSRAERLLEESVNERDESGSLEIAPQHIAPGFTYPVSNWGHAFPYGGQIGASSLYFDGDSYVDSAFGQDGTGDWTFEFLIHPQQLLTLGDDAYQTVFQFEDGDLYQPYVRIYGDGSVAFGDGNIDAGAVSRTDPGVIEDGYAQRLSVVFGGNQYPDRRVYVDGQRVATFDNYEVTIGDANQSTPYRIGADLDGTHGFVGGIDDVRLWTAARKHDDWIFEHYNEDLIEVGAALDGIAGYLRFDDFARPDDIVIDGIAQQANGIEATVTGAEFQDATGQLEEVQYSLGSGDTITLDFDISGRIDTELIRTQRASRSNRRSL